MGFKNNRVGLYFVFAAAIATAAGCGGSSSRKSSASTAAATTSGSTAATNSYGVANPTSGSIGSVSSATPLAAGPELQSVRYVDVDKDNRVSKGDQVVLGFAGDLEPVPAGLNPSDEIMLAVQGDTFGVGAKLVDGAKKSEVAVVLGDDPKLFVSETFDPATTTAGAASGLNLNTGATIKGQGTDVVRPAPAELDLDGRLQAGFDAAGSLNVARGGHNAVTLDDGRVLIVGGLSGKKRDDLVTESELFDPLTQSFTKVSDLSGDKGYMKRGRTKVKFFLGTAVKMRGGKVLICGGYGVERRGFLGLGKGKVDTLESAFEFDPKSNTFARVDDMKHSRHGHSATLLADGRVLIAGGYNDSFWRAHKTQAPLEVYDPKTRKFSRVGSFFRRTKLERSRMGHTATLLDGGKVVFAGGAYYTGGGLFGLIKPKLRTTNSSEVFDGKASQKAGDLKEARLNHAAARIGAGKVVVAGGHAVGGSPVRGVEVFDARARTWSSAGSLRTPRSNPKIGMFRDLALIIGGHAGSGETGWVEAFNTKTHRMERTRYRLRSARNGCTVSRLKDGRIVVIGGLVGGRTSYLSIDGQPLASCEVFVSH